VRLLAAEGELFAGEWRHFAFATNRLEALATVEAEHRQHAVVEQVIRDLKDQALAHFPSGLFSANAAWTVIACLAAPPAALDDPRVARRDRPRAPRAAGCSRCPGA